LSDATTCIAFLYNGAPRKSLRVSRKLSRQGKYRAPPQCN
jgi:hypothetical protein